MRSASKPAEQAGVLPSRRARAALRLRALADLCGYTYRTMIAPWPLFGALLLVLGLVGVAVPLAQIQVIAALVDRLAALPQPAQPGGLADLAGPMEALGPLLAALVGLRILGALLLTQTFQRYLAALMNERVQTGIYQSLLRKALGSRLEVFESASYYDTLQLARRTLQANRITDELVNMQMLVALVFGSLGVLGALAWVHWALPLVVLLGNLVVSSLYLRLTWNVAYLNEILNTLHRRATYLRDLVSRRESAAEVRLFQLGPHLVGRWRRQIDDLNAHIAEARSQVVLRLAPPSLVESLVYGAVAYGLLAGSGARGLSAGVFVAMLYTLLQLRGNLLNLRLLLGRSQQFYADLRHGAAFLALPSEQRRGGLPLAGPLRDGIRFENVTFCYPGAEQPAMRDLTLHIRPGERIAIVGENGAGKSTLTKLLLGLYQPSSGRILVDGVDLAEIDPAAWREHVGAVLQDFVRYALTARENIAVGRPELLADQAAVERAAALSGADTLVQQLPQGYDTLLSKEFDGGQDLSLGQWQKLALARAYLRDAPVLVLDEPTAALDVLTEQRIYRQFLSLSEEKTVLLISHRVGSARMADRIVVLQHGQLVQQGTHDELLLQPGLYAELYQLQAAWYQDEEVADV